jgi:hypothetical protein
LKEGKTKTTIGRSPLPLIDKKIKNQLSLLKMTLSSRGANEPINEQQQQQGCRSLSGELGLITAGLADGNTFVSASSKSLCAGSSHPSILHSSLPPFLPLLQ